MNKIVKGLLVTALAISASPTANATHTGHTFLMPRPTGVDLPMEITTYESLIGRKAEDKFGGDFQVTGFYKDSTNGKELAKYFLVHDKSTIAMVREKTPTAIKSPVTDDVDLGYLIHNCAITGAQNTAYQGTISLDPEIYSYGIRVDYHQDLDKILKGLYLKASLPIVCVETNVKIKTTGTEVIPDDVILHNADPVNNVAVKDALIAYLNGSNYNDNTANKQIKLDHALITGAHDATGVADIDIALGYKFLNRPSYYASLAIAITVPTGNEADGVYLFEPIYGNDQHFGLGGDLDAQARVWGDFEHNLKINLFMKYRYLFECHETRTLRIHDRPYSQYFLFGVKNEKTAKPAANILTQTIEVIPGSQFDGILGLTYNNGGFVFDAGYNLYFREKESIHLSNNFDETKYQIYARNWNIGSADFNPTNAEMVDHSINQTVTIPLKISDLSTNAPSTDSQFTNSVYGGLGYYFSEWEVPLMLGLGGKYEWASENSAPEQWTIYGKIGVGF